MGHEAIVDHVGSRIFPGTVHPAWSLASRRKPRGPRATQPFSIESSGRVR